MEERQPSNSIIADTQQISEELYILLDRALHSLNSLTKLNAHMQELIVAVLRGQANASNSALLKEIQEATQRARQEHIVFEQSQAEFKSRNFEQVRFMLTQDEQPVLSRFYQRVLDRMNRKLMVFVRYRTHLEFLANSIKGFSRMRDALALPCNNTSLLPFHEVASKLATENQILERLLIELIVSQNLISSVEEFNELQRGSTIVRKRISNKENSSVTTPQRYSRYRQTRAIAQSNKNTLEQYKTPKRLSVTDLFNKIRCSYISSQKFYSSINYEPLKEKEAVRSKMLSKQCMNKFGHSKQPSSHNDSPIHLRKNSFARVFPTPTHHDHTHDFAGKTRQITNGSYVMPAEESFENQINHAINQQFKRNLARKSDKRNEAFLTSNVSPNCTSEQDIPNSQPKIEIMTMEPRHSLRRTNELTQSTFRQNNNALKLAVMQVRKSSKVLPARSVPERFTKAHLMLRERKNKLLSSMHSPKSLSPSSVVLEPEKGFSEIGLASFVVARKYNLGSIAEAPVSQAPKQAEADDLLQNTFSSNLSSMMTSSKLDSRLTAHVFQQTSKQSRQKSKSKISPYAETSQDSLLRIPNFLKKILRMPSNNSTERIPPDMCINTQKLQLEMLPISTNSRDQSARLPRLANGIVPKVKIYCTRLYKIIS